jgi:hypothetical protein
MKNEKEFLITLLDALVFPSQDLSKAPISDARNKVQLAMSKRLDNIGKPIRPAVSKVNT